MLFVNPAIFWDDFYFGQLIPPVVYPEFIEGLPIFLADDFRINRTYGLAKRISAQVGLRGFYIETIVIS